MSDSNKENKQGCLTDEIIGSIETKSAGEN
jgi:hypothetical protein